MDLPSSVIPGGTDRESVQSSASHQIREHLTRMYRDGPKFMDTHRHRHGIGRHISPARTGRF